MRKSCNISLDSADQQIDSRDLQIKRDEGDGFKQKKCSTFQIPFENIKKLLKNEKINDHKAQEIDLKSMER